MAGEVKHVSESIDGITQSLEAEMGAAVEELSRLATNMRAESVEAAEAAEAANTYE